MSRFASRMRAAVAVVLLSLSVSACGYNTIPTLEEQAKAKWADVQNNYQRRADLIPNLVKTVKGYAAQEQRVLDVELTTAQELSDAEFDRIRTDIEKKSGRKVQASRTVDPDLIGGIVLQAGSMRLDASVRGRLERLRQQLATTR